MSELDALIKEVAIKLEKKSEELVKKTNIVTVTDDNVDKILKENKVVVVDCWAEWCSPCHLYEPIFEKVAEKYSGKATFGRLNVDENPKTADRYQVLNIPTTLIFVNGDLVDSVVGAVDEDTLESTLVKYLDRG